MAQSGNRRARKGKRVGDPEPGPAFASAAELFAAARAEAEYTRPGRRLLGHLYTHSVCRGTSREAWEADVRLAIALQKLLRDAFGNVRAPLVKDLLDTDASAAIAAAMGEAPATIALGYHGGFPRLRRAVFAHLFENSVTIAAGGEHGARDGAYALFAAREQLLQSRPVLMAPDGRFGKETATITVLGAQRAVADGAPFLAHSTNCRVAWFAVVNTGQKFAPALVEGPRAATDESFRAYRERFYRFYEAQVEAAFSGDPRNIDLDQSWRTTFDAMFDGKVDRERRSSLESGDT